MYDRLSILQGTEQNGAFYLSSTPGYAYPLRWRVRSRGFADEGTHAAGLPAIFTEAARNSVPGAVCLRVEEVGFTVSYRADTDSSLASLSVTLL
jgi:hypothetical protein